MKKLIVCLDGTSNKYARDNTNVIKFLAMLDKNATDQLIYYQPGIGTILPPGFYGRIRRWVEARLDLAFAVLLKYHVQDAFSFLMRYYEDGDQVFIFGFSRGAYTARVLAGMLHKVGLVARGNEEMVPFAWTMYATKGNDNLARGFRNTFGKKVAIDFLGVWDTVSSVRWAGREVTFPYTRENPDVVKVRHAIALDERRAYFRSNLWTSTPSDGQDVLQVWFPGVHCDVGGGYLEADSGLSKIALQWMVAHAELAGLAFFPLATTRMMPTVTTGGFAAPDPKALIHASLRGWWWVLEYLPKRVHDSAQVAATQWILPRGRRRTVPPGSAIHQSVFDRKTNVQAYDPPNLPANSIVNRTPALQSDLGVGLPLPPAVTASA